MQCRMYNVSIMNHLKYYYEYCIITKARIITKPVTWTKFVIPHLITLENHNIVTYSMCTFFIFSSRILNYGIAQFIT